MKENTNEPVFGSDSSREQRYEALVSEFYQDIYRYALWLCKSPQVAEDLSQETFLRAWRALDSLEKPEAAKAWLFTILRRENARMYEKFRPELDDIDDVAVPEKASYEPDQHLERDLLYRAMTRLETEYREPLVLQVLGGFSGDEIASMLELNSNTVMTRLFRARKKLKALLDNTDETPD